MVESKEKNECVINRSKTQNVLQEGQIILSFIRTCIKNRSKEQIVWQVGQRNRMCGK